PIDPINQWEAPTARATLLGQGQSQPVTNAIANQRRPPCGEGGHDHFALTSWHPVLVQHLEQPGQGVHMQATAGTLENEWRTFRRSILIHEPAAEYLANDFAVDRQD